MVSNWAIDWRLARVGRVPWPGALRSCHNETSPNFLRALRPWTGSAR